MLKFAAMRLKIMLEKQFGRLTVVNRVGNTKDGKPQYFCRCVCGKTVVARGKQLRSGKTQSCKCLRYERLKKSLTTHGYSFTKTYKVWGAMSDRCRNQKCIAFKHYGGRGITICERWLKFENFLADMGHRPKGKTIDRINVNGNYEPSNCRWATPIQQANNTRGVRRITHKGVTQTISEWAMQLSIPRTTIALRLERGLPVVEILKPKQVPALAEYKGNLMTYPQIAKAAGMSYITLRWRLRKGLSLAKALAS
jgi:hypothetical protein